MRYVLSAPNVGSPAALVDLAIECERGGWDAFVCWDHLHMVRAEGLDVLDPWVLLGAVAHATHTVRVGPLVTPLARRRPWVVAKEAVTLDHLSDGRAVLGVGLGEPAEDEFGAFGEPTDDRERAALLDESLELLVPLLAGEPVVHEGTHYRIDASLRPGARQQPRPPIWVAATAPHVRPLRRALRYDAVVPIASDGGPLTPEGLAEYLEPVELPAGFDVVAGAFDVTPPREYEEAGATWLVYSRWPAGDWLDELLTLARAGPPR
jgi:alkanesulfonate monooxygenase SsuD/methylene tetrahydromethanopterin reductase-like flavin-dependent oxidoreductase (luciferase family)